MSMGKKEKRCKQSVNTAKEKKHPPKPCKLCDFFAQAGRGSPQRSLDLRGNIKFVVFEQCKDEPDKFTSS